MMNYLSDELVVTNQPVDAIEQASETTPEFATKLLEIDVATGRSYCMDSDELYREMLETFCQQATETLTQLETYYQLKDWSNYAIIAHGLKTNARTIGANNFAEFSLKHELAGKEGDESFILKKYDDYIWTLKQLIPVIKKMLTTEQ